MKRIVYLISIFVILSVFSNHLFAEINNYEKRIEAARCYAKEFPISITVDNSLKNMAANMPEDKKKEFISFMKQVIDIDEIEKVYLQIIIKHFNEKELNALCKFYSSPEGKSIMKKMGPYTIEITPLIINTISKAMEQFHNEK